MLRTGYIVSRRDDLVWFLGLPFVAVAIALAMQHWLPAVALASVTLLITAPHHFVTWLRTYGLADEWRRWKLRLIVAPLVLVAFVAAGVNWAPATLALVAILWDHQHSVMQQYGFSRIYDFKAGTGGQSTARVDFALCWILYVNLLATSPLSTRYWVAELVRWGFSPSIALVHQIQTVSWSVTVASLLLYGGYLAYRLSRGESLNPIKLVFVASSYFLWYFTSWHTDSILVLGIAHRIMHGVQYIVVVYWYLRRKTEPDDSQGKLSPRKLVAPHHVARFVVACLLYAVAFLLISGQPLERLGFGLINVTGRLDVSETYHVYAESVFSIMALTHYYFDSFIWKVRDERIQGGL